MASYAALASLKTIVHTIQNHPNPPIYLDSLQVESLVEKVTFLQEFLEAYSHHEAYPVDGLESSMRDAAYAAEDVIESYISDQIDTSTSSRGDRFYGDIQKVIEDMDIIKKAAAEIKQKMGDGEDDQHISFASGASPASPSVGQKTIMVGFDAVLIQLLDRLTGQQSSRQIIPITGMGGIGKTTLAINAYEHALVIQQFDIRAWVTISQKFKMQEILLEILCQRNPNKRETLRHLSEELLGERIHKTLSGRRYLIVMDDLWNTESWDRIRRFLPDNNNGSRIIITTRISNMAIQLTSSNSIKMNLLDADESWNLLRKIVFTKDECPLELEEIGKTIAKNCKGLPISIVVIGGLLTMSNRRKQHWKNVSRNLSSIVNLANDDHCMKVLYMSYQQLPIHLKPCFLYMGIFREDAKIRVSWLVKLLVAEGFLKPIGNKILEVIAKEYIKDLIDRNLILVDEWGSIGSIKFCKIHDLVRDLCLREAQKDKFLHMMWDQNFGMDEERRIVIPRQSSKEGYPPQHLGGSLYTSRARSLICECDDDIPSLKFRLLRVLNSTEKERSVTSRNDSTNFQKFYNLRYLSLMALSHFKTALWSLQTLMVQTSSATSMTTPIEIWNMPQLRHVNVGYLDLSSPPNDSFIFWNLQTLSPIIESKCCENMVERIPNIKKLTILHSDVSEGNSNSCLNNLEHLQKLEHLRCMSSYYAKGDFGIGESYLRQKLTFPHSIRKLDLQGPNFYWKDITIMVGSLPCLQKLRLTGITGLEWRTEEGHFLCLKYLEIYGCQDFESWIVDTTHFPRLERLSLYGLRELEEISFEIGEIQTLQLIEVTRCNDSLVNSTKKIAEEQDELGNSSLQVRVHLSRRNDELESLASHNFHVKTDA